MLEIRTPWGLLTFSEIDKDNEIEISDTFESKWLSIDQTKQLIEFLTKQIEESSNRFIKN